MDKSMMHATMSIAAAAAVADGRIKQDHMDYLNAFMTDPMAFSLGNIVGIILPILSAVFPQFAPLIAIIGQFFGGGTPTPTPAPVPTPTPAPGGFFAQLIAFFQSLFAGGKLPVPLPTPAPAPVPAGDIIVPTPSP